MKKRLALQDPEGPDTPDELAQMVANLAPLVDRAYAAPPKGTDDPASTTIAIALGLTPAQAEEARAFGFL